MQAAADEGRSKANGLRQAITPEFIRSVMQGANGDPTGLSSFTKLAEIMPQRAALAAAKNNFKNTSEVQKQDDMVGLKGLEIMGNQGMARAKMLMDMRDNALADVEKFKPKTVLNKDGIPVEDPANNALTQRMATDNGAANELNPEKRAAMLQRASTDSDLVNRYNTVASPGLRQDTPLNVTRTDTVGLEDMFRGGAGFGAMLRGKFMPGTPNEVAVNRTPDGQEQRVLMSDLTDGNASRRALVLQSGLRQQQEQLARLRAQQQQQLPGANY
jgi:hypothetical protein